VAPYHTDTPFFAWHAVGDYLYRNVVIDYEAVRHHCWEVDRLDTLYARDSRMAVWPESRWPWDGEVIPIPVYNEEAFTDTIDLSVVSKPTGWLTYLNQTSVILEPGMADTVFLSVIPKGATPPLPPDHVVTVEALKGFCDEDAGYLYIEFLPFSCLCIPDYLGKVVENLPGNDPELVPGDTVLVSLMLENDMAVTAVQVDLTYNPDYLRPDTTLLTWRSAGMALYESEVDPGLYRIMIDFTPDPHPVIAPSSPDFHCQNKAGEAALSVATVLFIIQDEAQPGTCANIWPVDVHVTGLPDVDGEPKEDMCPCFDHGQVCFGG